jgi:hypothetical protein
MTDTWVWLALIGLGTFHGLNPAMGWLFSVGLGLHHKSRAKVLWSLVPIGAGHALSIAAVVATVTVLRDWINLRVLQWVGAIGLIAFGVYRFIASHRPRRSGMQVHFHDLLLWSFLSATGHGAGLMLLPLLLHTPDHSGHLMRTGVNHAPVSGVTATIVHSAATLVTTGIIAILVYDWIGLNFLRRGWINTDWVWSIALMTAGLLLLILNVLGY